VRFLFVRGVCSATTHLTSLTPPHPDANSDPRWGRNQEVPSESPLINGDFGTQYTLGLQQGVDAQHLQAVVTLKHWDAYSLEDAGGFTRHSFNAVVSPYALAHTYFPAFRKSVTEGGATGVSESLFTTRLDPPQHAHQHPPPLPTPLLLLNPFPSVLL
jgi:beta-glucosidase-like glycosyl hydrolase